ncbi:MAG: response regulator [Gammaproteobacteria bacterium]
MKISHAECPDIQSKQDIYTKILLVEDNLIAQSIAKTLLDNMGYQVEVADCALQVLETFAPGKFDFIFMDIGLPDLEGTTVTRHLRNIEKSTTFHVPIVALSAHAADTIISQCLESGMDDVLSKPLSQDKVSKIFNKYLKASLLGKDSARRSPLTNDVISKNPDKHLLALLMKSLPESEAEIANAYQSHKLDSLGRAVHKLYGALCYTDTPQLRQAVGDIDEALRHHMTHDLTPLYQNFLTTIKNFKEEYQKIQQEH